MLRDFIMPPPELEPPVRLPPDDVETRRTPGLRGAVRARGAELRRFGAAGEFQPVYFADNGISRYAFAQDTCNLACAEAFQPKFLE